MTEQLPYSLNDIKRHVKILINEFEENCKEYTYEMSHINNNRNNWGTQKTLRKIRKLTYAINGHYIDIIETLKNCNKYLQMNNQTNLSNNQAYLTSVNINEFKNIRKNIKKRNKKEIDKLQRNLNDLRKERNKVAHKMCEMISSFLFYNKNKILDSLNSYLTLLNKVSSHTNEVKALKKLKDLGSKQFHIFNKVLSLDSEQSLTPTRLTLSTNSRI